MGIIILIVTIIIIYIIIYINQENGKRQRLQNQREQERIERENENRRQKKEEMKRTEQQNDKRYDQIINCPVCLGNGKVYLDCQSSGGYEKIWAECYNLSYGKERLDEWCRNQNNMGDMGRHWIEEDSCPFCQGKGLAYAWFEKTSISTNCSKCQGIGETSISIKLEIGIENKKIRCDKCNGTGKSHNKEYVHIKTLAGKNEIQIEEQEETNFILSISYRDGYNNPAKFRSEITDENRDFFSKSKPRFS